MKKLTKTNAFKVTFSTIAVLSIASSALLIAAFAPTKGTVSNLKTQIRQEKLNAVDYRFENDVRLAHNKNEPIYIEISNDFNNEQRETINDVLDHVFALVGDVNECYKYQIVDNVNKSDYLNKTTISFAFDNSLTNTIYGKAKRTNIDGTLKGYFVDDLDITFNPQVAKSSPEKFKQTVLHEVLHGFGIDDLYKKEEFIFNSAISTASNKLDLVTPNDYKLLLAMYASNSIEDNILADLKYEEYCKFYYNEYSNFLLSKEQSKNIKGDIQKTFSMPYNTDVRDYKIETSGDKYVLTTFDKDNKVMEKCEGKIYRTESGIFLRNVHLNNFIKNKETYMDFHVYTNGNGLSCRFLECEPLQQKKNNPTSGFVM